MQRLDIALIGCGGIANLHVSGYKDLHTRGLRIFEIKAVCDTVIDNAKTRSDAIAYFQGAEPRIYQELDELLENESLNAVDLCLPHNVHHNVASRCLEEDLHVITEKPLGITMRAAKGIISEAEKHRKVLAVAENYRRSPENRTKWWTIKQGLIGKPRMIVWSAAGWNSQPWGWREDKMIAGGSWVFDGGVHLADLDRYHLGAEAVEVYSVNDTFEPLKKGVKVTVDDMTMAIIRYEGGAYAQWLWTRVAPAKSIGMHIIYGSKGAITDEDIQIQREDCTESYGIGTLRRRMTESLSHEELEGWFPSGATDTFATELYDFYDSIVNRRKPEVDGWEAYKDMAIPIGFYESAVLGQPVKIEDIEGLKVEEYQGEINEKLGLKG